MAVADWRDRLIITLDEIDMVSHIPRANHPGIFQMTPIYVLLLLYVVIHDLLSPYPGRFWAITLGVPLGVIAPLLLCQNDRAAYAVFLFMMPFWVISGIIQLILRRMRQENEKIRADRAMFELGRRLG